MWRYATPDRVKSVTARHCEEAGVRIEDVLSSTRKKRIARVRWAIWSELRALRRSSGAIIYSYPQLGRYFHRDHSTILYGVRRFNGLDPYEAKRDRPKYQPKYLGESSDDDGVTKTELLYIQRVA